MKKFVVVVLCLIMSLGLFACKDEKAAKTDSGGQAQTQGNTGSSNPVNPLPAQQETAYALWTKASNSQKSSESLSFIMDYQMQAEGFTMSMAGPIQMVTKGTDMQMFADIKMDMLGSNLDMQMWYKDGYYYVNSMGMKIKQAMPFEQALQQSNSQLISFDESAIKEQTITEGAGGSKTMTFVLDGKALASLSNGALATSGLGSSASVEMGDVTVVAVVDKDGNLADLMMNFGMAVDISGQKATFTCQMSMTSISLAPIAIQFPSDLDTYAESSL